MNNEHQSEEFSNPEIARLRLEVEQLRQENARLKEANLFKPAFPAGLPSPEFSDLKVQKRPDLTEKGEALPPGEQLFRQLLQTIPQMVWITREDGYVEFYNQPWYDYTAATPQETEGNGWSKVLHPDDINQTQQLWYDCVKSGKPYQIEYRLRNGKTGEYCWFLGRALPLKGEDGTILKWFGTCTDINEQRRAVERLRLLGEVSTILASSLEYEQTLQKVAEQVVTYLGEFCVIDLFDEPQALSFRRVAIAGADPEKVAIAREIDHRYPPDWSGPHPLAQALKGGVPFVIAEFNDESLQAQAHNQEHLALLHYLNPKSSISVPFTVRGRTIGVFSCISSTPDRFSSPEDVILIEELGRRTAAAIDNARLYEETGQALQTRLELDSLKDLFMSVASHELRTPLTAIKGYAQLLQRALINKGNSALSETNLALEFSRLIRLVENIDYQSNRMNAMINQLLDFSRLQNQQLHLQYTEKLDITGIVERVVEQHKLNPHSHTFRVQLATSPILVSFDPARIEQVLDNLINNAVKYSPRQTTITIGVELAYQAPDHQEIEEVVVFVKDEGNGISPQEQAHIFDRFYRIRNKETTRIEGLGLGLYISSEIIRQHGGRMWLKSEVGQGSTFYFTLPLAHP